MKENNDNRYIEDLQEWQDNQYNPGHYLGGKIPGYLLNSGRSKLVGSFIILIGLMTLIPIIFISVGFFHSNQTLRSADAVLQLVKMFAVGAFGLLMTVSGIRKIIQGDITAI
jgi:hypothetical protein